MKPIVTVHTGLLARVEAYFGYEEAARIAALLLLGGTTREAVALWLDECDLG